MDKADAAYYAKELGDYLAAEKLSLSVAESCTAGLISHKITDIPGSSRYFRGGIIAYTDQIKINLLKVPREIIQRYGAVSAQTVRHMALNVAALFDTQCAIAVSGIAGPDGGTPTKPVGLVWISVLSPGGIFTHEYNFKGDRVRIKHQAACTALELMLSALK